MLCFFISLIFEWLSFYLGFAILDNSILLDDLGTFYHGGRPKLWGIDLVFA
jgi:hypothetical protein